jgi:hypothetical protein
VSLIPRCSWRAATNKTTGDASSWVENLFGTVRPEGLQ